jgi:hypothetical protein
MIALFMVDIIDDSWSTSEGQVMDSYWDDIEVVSSLLPLYTHFSILQAIDTLLAYG